MFVWAGDVGLAYVFSKGAPAPTHPTLQVHFSTSPHLPAVESHTPFHSFNSGCRAPAENPSISFASLYTRKRNQKNGASTRRPPLLPTPLLSPRHVRRCLQPRNGPFVLISLCLRDVLGGLVDRGASLRVQGGFFVVCKCAYPHPPPRQSSVPPFTTTIGCNG